MSDNTDRYAVFGNPIEHSKSPFIHARFAEQTGQRLSYTAELVEPGDFEKAVARFADNNGKGLNVTVPFKQDAWQLATRRSERAERAGAVNTLVINAPGDYFGDNTDGIGLVMDLGKNFGFELANKNILIIGAGGAVRGVIEPLLEQRPASLTIANRTREKAVQLADDFSDLGTITGCGLDEFGEDSFDIIINGTSASLVGELPPLPASLIGEHTFCYDMMYASEATPFTQWASQHGAARVADGKGMLVEQAAESFRIWRGCKPETAPVIEALSEL
ncbi:MAG: shikimate dehydrogenase [Gammaproteobacteria bacterium]|nr:shikimate dehydrogenase [Gammaproteobacteria bacterium]NNL07547.1 shikimate dehydrogenase [Gammaproteobacteria bacterium]